MSAFGGKADIATLDICAASRAHGNLAPMDADHRKRDDRLFTIKEVTAVLPVSERTLRDVIRDLGFRRPPGRKRYLFDAAQVAAIKEAVQCRSTIPPEHRAAARARLTRLANRQTPRRWPTG